jgi:hypothetical protein
MIKPASEFVLISSSVLNKRIDDRLEKLKDQLAYGNLDNLYKIGKLQGECEAMKWLLQTVQEIIKKREIDLDMSEEEYRTL